MRSRIWVVTALAVFLVLAASCSSGNAVPTVSGPAPVKTLRPTYTPAAAQAAPTKAAPAPTSAAAAVATKPAVAAAATATTQPATPTAAAAEKPMLTVSTDTVNVRSGPSTDYVVLGQVQQGQQFEILGKNPAGDWWQFLYQGQQGWLIGRLVTVNGAAGNVKVATNIPAAPTAAPVPTAGPQPTSPPPAPTAPVATTYRFGVTKNGPRSNTNDLITVWCFVMNKDTSRASGTLRVVSNGATLGEVNFTNLDAVGDAGLFNSQFLYNQGCKVEIRPATPGTYQAYLVQGGQQISDAFSFTVTNDLRTFIIEWTARQ